MVLKIVFSDHWYFNSNGHTLSTPQRYIMITIIIKGTHRKKQELSFRLPAKLCCILVLYNSIQNPMQNIKFSLFLLF